MLPSSFICTRNTSSHCIDAVLPILHKNIPQHFVEKYTSYPLATVITVTYSSRFRGLPLCNNCCCKGIPPTNSHFPKTSMETAYLHRFIFFFIFCHRHSCIQLTWITYEHSDGANVNWHTTDRNCFTFPPLFISCTELTIAQTQIQTKMHRLHWH